MKPSPNKGRSFERRYRRSSKHVIYPHPSATSTYVHLFGSVSLSDASSPRTEGLLCDFCTSPGGAWRGMRLTTMSWQRLSAKKPRGASLTTHSDCLSSVCCRSKVVLASYCLLLDLHFGRMPFKEETETKYRGLAPHKITPMSGVHRPKISLLRLLVFSLVFDLGHHNSYPA